MRILVTGIKTTRHGLGVVVSIRHRQGQWDRTVWVPWKWLAVAEVDQALWAEHLRTRRSRACCDQGSLIDML